jgi:hypothetical protein
MVRESLYIVLKLTLEAAAERGDERSVFKGSSRRENPTQIYLDELVSCLFDNNTLRRNRKEKCKKHRLYSFFSKNNEDYDAIVDSLMILRKAMGKDILDALELGEVARKIAEVYDQAVMTRKEELELRIKQIEDKMKSTKRYIRQVANGGVRVNMGIGSVFQSIPLFSFDINFGAKKKIKLAEFVLDVQLVMKRIYTELLKEEENKKTLMLYALKEKGMYRDLLRHFSEFIESSQPPPPPDSRNRPLRPRFLEMPDFSDIF